MSKLKPKALASQIGSVQVSLQSEKTALESAELLRGVTVGFESVGFRTRMLDVMIAKHHHHAAESTSSLDDLHLECLLTDPEISMILESIPVATPAPTAEDELDSVIEKILLSACTKLPGIGRRIENLGDPKKFAMKLRVEFLKIRNKARRKK